MHQPNGQNTTVYLFINPCSLGIAKPVGICCILVLYHKSKMTVSIHFTKTIKKLISFPSHCTNLSPLCFQTTKDYGSYSFPCSPLTIKTTFYLEQGINFHRAMMADVL